MQSNSFSGLESYSRVKYSVSEIVDCRIAEEQGHSFTTVLQIIRISAWKQVHNIVRCCFTYPVYKTEDQDPDGQQQSCSLQITGKATMLIRNLGVLRRVPPTLAPAVPVIISSKPLFQRLPPCTTVNWCKYTSLHQPVQDKGWGSHSTVRLGSELR